MPTPTLNPKITAAGLALFPSPAQMGFSIQLTHVALGTGKYTPAVNGSGQATQTALTAEVARFPITSGTNPSPRQVQVGLTITDTDPNGHSLANVAVGEIGFYAGTTLFAVWSQPTDPLFIKSPAFDVPLAYTLDVSILPASSVTITVDATGVGLAAFILQHEAKVDPHPQYLTPAEGDAAYVHQGGGIGQLTTVVNIGKSSTDPTKLKATIGAGDLGNFAFEPWVAAQIAALVNSSPGALDTLKELADALGDDANFAATMTTALAGKERKFDTGTRMVFPQAAAPTGYTQVNDDSTNNRMLRVVNGAGGGTGGVHDPSLNNVVPSHTHGFTTGYVSADHSHAIGDPGHNHSTYLDNNIGGNTATGAVAVGVSRFLGASNPTANIASATGIWTAGVSANHTHSGSTDNGSSQTSWTPRYNNMIICSKN